MRNFVCEHRYMVCDIARIYSKMLYNIKAKLCKIIKFGVDCLINLRITCIHKIKCEEVYITLCSHLVVELTNRTGTKVTWILVFCSNILDCLVDTLKVCICDNGFAANDKSIVIRNLIRNVGKYLGVICDNLTNLTVATCYCLHKLAVLISKNNCKTIHFPGKYTLLVGKPVCKYSDILCLI